MKRAATTISVVVCTRNRAELLRSCLQSLIAQDLGQETLETIVVDDGSTDSTEEVVKQVSATGAPIRYFRQEHAGVNAARNAGIELARGEVIAFLDDDEAAPPDHLRRVVEILAARPSTAGVGGPLVEVADRALGTCSDCSLGSTDLPGAGDREVDRLIGGNMAIRRTAFDRYGLFDSAISGRGDELEWFHRARGARFLHLESLAVEHRRDTFGILGLAAHAFRQGMALPQAWRKMGKRYPRRPRRIFLGLGHALRHRCARGVVTACREIGAIFAWLGRWFGRERDGVSWSRPKEREP